VRYFVLDDTGSEYGPADLPTLQEWVRQNRIAPHTRLRNETTGESVMAVEIRELMFPQPGEPSSPQIPPAANPGDYYRSAGSVMSPPDTTTALVWAILATLFCCQPLGIAAIVFAAMAMSSNTGGNFEQANKQIDTSKKLVYWAVGAWVVMIVLYLLFVGAMGMAGGFN
jgi:hypothetical protein